MTIQSEISGVVKLETRIVPKVWGRQQLPRPFTNPGDTPIGEIWFEPHSKLPDLLVKYLFTSEKLSVQVHPGAEDVLEGEAAKEECWLVLDAEPGARLAIGLEREVSTDVLREAALDGSIEDLLTWHEAKAGDVFYLPTGTVHAIGPGLSLVEIQQNSETTFRLYDYGRPRELHLDRALAVAQPVPFDSANRTSVAESRATLIDGPFFRLDRIEGAPSEELRSAYSDRMLALPLSGELVSPDGQARAETGECLFAPHIDAIDFAHAGVTLLIRP